MQNMYSWNVVLQQVISKLQPDFEVNTQPQLNALFVFFLLSLLFFLKISISVISVNSIWIMDYQHTRRQCYPQQA